MKRFIFSLAALMCAMVSFGQITFKDLSPDVVVTTQDEMGYPLNILEGIATTSDAPFYIQNYWFEDYAATSYIAVFGDGAAVVILPSQVFSAGLVEKLNQGATIGASSNWSSEMFPVLHDEAEYFAWQGQISYAGLKVRHAGNTYYAWVKLGINANHTFTVYEYAIETTPGKAIAAGDKGSVSIRSVEFDNLEAYPNPANDVLTVVNSEKAESISITDMMGREVLKVNATMGEQQVDLSSLESGNYLLTIKTDKGLKVKKIVLR